jgi:hypothetical protein
VAARAGAGGAARAGKAEEAVTAAAVFARVVERRGALGAITVGGKLIVF